MIKLYIWMDGRDFAAQRFVAEMSLEKQGEIKFRKKIVNGETQKGDHYWMSNPVKCIDHLALDAQCLALLNDLSPALARKQSFNVDRACLEIVLSSESEEKAGGFFLSNSTISMATSLGLDIDVDIA